ncbi:protein of unknown function [Methylotuvimicrobium alcaliphilum 20Z]|uniref:Uncharacterized protein n=1 Tax=Methylotuvimicrobium alcaliphilum (strain DSM 19304 / NCIMB 14124 / VKM B-2133 / 20Z) TaxID=1091494 RepID=G4SW25_META2|nr:protein of unknown function [Methylotuvimicrobium alcaliphilum 20Z]
MTYSDKVSYWFQNKPKHVVVQLSHQAWDGEDQDIFLGWR